MRGIVNHIGGEGIGFAGSVVDYVADVPLRVGFDVVILAVLEDRFDLLIPLHRSNN